MIYIGLIINSFFFFVYDRNEFALYHYKWQVDIQ